MIFEPWRRSLEGRLCCGDSGGVRSSEGRIANGSNTGASSNVYPVIPGR